MKRNLKIIISNQLQLKCVVIDKNNTESTIKLNPKDDQDEYSLTFTFENNNIDYIQHLIQSPEDYKLYTIQFDQQEYQVVAEVLFALILDDFIKSAKKQYILCRTFIELPNENKMFEERINVSLDAIGLKGIDIGEEITYDYEEQGMILNEILEKKETKQKYNHMLNKAKQKTISQKQKRYLEMNKQNISTEEQFRNIIANKFTTRERSKMKLCTLDNYCIFIASRYLNSIEDHFNLTMVSKRLEKNMEKFHYNPISVNLNTVKFFPNIETLHKYYKEDECLVSGRIERYVDWIKRTLTETLSFKRKNLQFINKIEFKNCVYVHNDFPNELVEKTKNNFVKISIPNYVKEIENDVFKYQFYQIEDICIENENIKIPMKCFEECEFLTGITIPLNETRVLYGNKIYNNRPRFGFGFYLPESIKRINNHMITDDSFKTFAIPSHVTYIEPECINEIALHFNQIIIPDSISPKFDLPFLSQSTCLTSISLPLNKTRIIYGNKICNNKPKFGESISLPNSIKMINKRFVDEFTSFEIPSFVTSFDSKCLSNLTMNLKQLIIPENINKKLNYSFVKNCSQLTSIRIPLNETRVIYGNKIFNNQPRFGESISLPNSIKKINDNFVHPLFEFSIPTFVTSISADHIIPFEGIKHLIIPPSLTTLPKQYFLNFIELEKLTISSEFKFIEQRLFISKDGVLDSYPLPNSVVNVNDCCNSTLTYFEIPSNVTKLGNNCFENCSHLSKIDGLERIRQFGKGCFAHCNQLNVKDYPFLKKKWKKLK